MVVEAHVLSTASTRNGLRCAVLYEAPAARPRALEEGSCPMIGGARCQRIIRPVESNIARAPAGILSVGDSDLPISIGGGAVTESGQPISAALELPRFGGQLKYWCFYLYPTAWESEASSAPRALGSRSKPPPANVAAVAAF